MTINMYLIVITDDFGGLCNVQTCLTLDNLIQQMNKVIEGVQYIRFKVYS